MGVEGVPTICRFGKKLKIEHLVGEWFKVPASESLSMCYISNCTDAAIFLLGVAADQVVIRSCENCRIVIAACLGSIHIENSKSSAITCAARSIQIFKSSNCFLYTFCLRPVEVDSRCSRLIFGPFNAFFSQQKELVERHSDLFPQELENPINFVVEGGHNSCSVLDPDDFVLYPIPFEKYAPSAFLIPSAYQQGLERRQARLLEVQNMIKTSSAHEPSRRAIQSELEHHFKVWLRDSGEHIFIDLLSKPMFEAKLQTVSCSSK